MSKIKELEQEINRLRNALTVSVGSVKDLMDELAEAKAETERKRQIIIAMQDCVGCGDPLWGEVQEMIDADARIIAELKEPVIVEAVLKEKATP